MKVHESLKKIAVYGILILIILFNFYLYRSEFTVLSDPNDNIFHAALVDEAHAIWKNVLAGKLSPFYLFDSWNERWAEGFALSSYYAHLPQAVISFFSFITPFSAYEIFVFVRTFLLVMLPVSFFMATRILNLPIVYGLIVSFFSQAIFTDGLYGIDTSSFIWRGWGLSAQLIAVFFLPLAFAYTIDYLENKRNLGKAILFNFIVGQSHFGVLFLLLLGYPIYWLFSIEKIKAKIPVLSQSPGPLWVRRAKNTVASFIFSTNIENVLIILKRTFVLLLLIFLSLAYFILPFFWLGKYRNFSYWDPFWKFDSWGIKQVIIWFTNGDLFDFNRLPFITGLVFGGIFTGLISDKRLIRYLTALFGLYFILFFGRTTLGPIIDLVPGFSEYHLHRVVIMVQFCGIFISGWFLYLLIKKVTSYWLLVTSYFSKKKLLILNNKTLTAINSIIMTIVILLTLGLIYILEKPVIKYVKDNQEMIIRANIAYQKDYPDYKKITDRLRSLPKARVYPGRPGNWGKDFKVGDTQVYMALSRDGFATVGFLPESWSPNSDTEQFFNEDSLDYYRLYNVGYLILPADKKAPEFAKLIDKAGNYLLYSVPTDGWFSFGRSTVTVSAKKTDLLNVIRLWFGSSLFMKNYPEISLGTRLEPSSNKKDIKMVDLNNYLDKDENKTVWQENPFLSMSETVRLPAWQKTQETVLVNGYFTRIELKEDCDNCLMVFKQSYNPNWQVYLNSKRVKTVPVFPFFIGIPINNTGSYTIQATYEPSIIKIILIIVELGLFAVIYIKRLNK